MVSLDSIRQRCPQAVALSSHEVEVAARGFLLRLTLPHADVLPAGQARWGSARQKFFDGKVSQSSMWDDEDAPKVWESTFDSWVEAWLNCLNGGALPGPADPQVS